MSLLKLESQTRKVVDAINDELTKVEKQRERLVNKPQLVKSLYAFSIECMADEDKAKNELEGYKPSAKGKNPHHAPVKYQLQTVPELTGFATKFCPADLTHFGVIFNDAHHRGVAVEDIVKELKRYRTKLAWYEAVNDRVRQRVLGLKEHAAAKIKKLNAKGGLVDIRQGDCLSILKSLPDESVDAVITDPPYGIGIDDWDKLEDVKVLWDKVFYECYRVLKHGGFLLAFGSPRTYHVMTTKIENSGFKIKDMISRLYFNGYPKDKYALKCANEPIVVAVKDSGRLNIRDVRKETWPVNVVGDLGDSFVEQQKFIYKPITQSWEKHIGFELMPENEREQGELFNADGDCPLVANQKKDWIDENGNPKWNNHKCVKPMELMGWLIKLATKPGETVLDPFMGSGSTGLGCLLTGRNFIGLELDERYFKVAETRLHFFMEQINGKKPVAHLGQWLKDASELIKEPANQSKDKDAA